MKRDEDDLINQLLDETYEVTSHPGKDLPSSKVASLSDHFDKMSHQYEEEPSNGSASFSPLGKIYFHDSFIRVQVKETNLDIPYELSPFREIQSGDEDQLFEIRDEAFKLVLENLVGEPITQVRRSHQAEFFPSGPQSLSNYLKKFAA